MFGPRGASPEAQGSRRPLTDANKGHRPSASGWGLPTSARLRRCYYRGPRRVLPVGLGLSCTATAGRPRSGSLPDLSTYMVYR
jgi:hypothetical protein